MEMFSIASMEEKWSSTNYSFSMGEAASAAQRKAQRKGCLREGYTGRRP